MSDNYFYFSIEKVGGWSSAQSTQRSKVIETKKPKYVTVLDLSALVADDASLEDTLKIKYSGPFYADWDCPDIEEGAAAVNRYLDLLVDSYDLDLGCISLYATGGRGFHAEIPHACFSSAKGGVAYLPAIYKEVANETYVEFLDLAVYSGKRGRMWRTPNVERETPGRYKVPISLQQMRDMTQESYDALCSEPQPFPELTPPVLNPQLAALYGDIQAKVVQRYRERSKKKPDDAAVRRMNGEWPASVKMLMEGNNVSPDVGLNKVALQLGILSNALGKSLDDHLDACEGLIKNYQGDGHQTRRAVREELKRMYGYACGNNAYSYSAAAMSHIMDVPQHGTKDLRGGAGAEAGKAQDDMSDLARGIVNGTNGIYSMKEDALIRETNWHFDAHSVVEIEDAETCQSRGFILQGMSNGVNTRELNIDHGVFISGDKFKAFLAAQGAIAPNLDTAKAGKIGALVMQAANSNGKLKALSKEGLNLLPGGEFVWASPTGCWAHDSKHTYKFRSGTGSEGGNFQSDVMAAPQVGEYEAIADVIDALMNFNLNDYTVAAVLGWYMACWQKPLHVALHGSFPILQAYGESGAGKTLMCMTLMKLFYYRNAPKMMNASQGTAYGRRVLFSGSTTIPVLVDEFKPSRMSQAAAQEFRMMLHEMYTPAFQAPRGGGDPRSSASGNWAELSMETKTTPLCFTTETAESETAIQERTIAAPFSKSARSGRADEAFGVLSAHPDGIAAVGKLLLHATAAAKPESLKTLIARSHTVASESLTRSGNSRIVYNAGVVLAGLGFFGMALRHALPEEFETRFEPRLKVLREAVLDPKNYSTLQAAPEIVKMLRFMVTVSHQDESDADHNVRHGREYAYTQPLDLDISVDAFYLRYRTAASRRSQSPVFQDPDSFLAALRSSSLLKEAFPPDTMLNEGTNAPRVVRLCAAALEEYKLGAFKV